MELENGNVKLLYNLLCLKSEFPLSTRTFGYFALLMRFLSIQFSFRYLFIQLFYTYNLLESKGQTKYCLFRLKITFSRIFLGFPFYMRHIDVYWLIFGPRKDERGSGEGFTIRNFIVLFLSPNIIRVTSSRRFRWAEKLTIIEEERSAFRILTGKRPLEQPRRS